MCRRARLGCRGRDVPRLARCLRMLARLGFWRLRGEARTLGRALELNLWRRRFCPLRDRSGFVVSELVRMLEQIVVLSGRLLVEAGIRRGRLRERRRTVSTQEAAFGLVALLSLRLGLERREVRLVELGIRLVIQMSVLVMRVRRGAVEVARVLQLLEVGECSSWKSCCSNACGATSVAPSKRAEPIVGSRRTGPSASRSMRSISAGSPPRARLRSRCSRIASSSRPMRISVSSWAASDCKAATEAGLFRCATAGLPGQRAGRPGDHSSLSGNRAPCWRFQIRVRSHRSSCAHGLNSTRPGGSAAARGYSSVGRAPGSHPGGRRFESV